jgi:hypothetical protein
LAGLEIQGAKATVAVGQKRAHAEFVGQGKSFPVVGFRQCEFRRFAPRRNVAEEP